MTSHFITGYCVIRNGTVHSHLEHVPASGESVSDRLEELYGLRNPEYPKFYKMDVLSKLGIIATDFVLSENTRIKKYSPESVAVILANKNSSLDTDIAFAATMEKMASPALFVYTLPNIVTGEICIRYGWKGENAFFIQESFDIEFITDYVKSVLEKVEVNACLVGWIDVLGEEHDVFLYLVEKVQPGNGIAHSNHEILKLYCANYGSIDGRSESSDH